VRIDHRRRTRTATAASRLPNLARRTGAGNRSAPARQRSLARVPRARKLSYL